MKSHKFNLLSQLYYCKKKLSCFFHALRHSLPTSRLILLLYEACFHGLHLEKKLLFFSIYLLRQGNKRALSMKVLSLKGQFKESWKVKKKFPPENFFDTAVQFNRFNRFVLWKTSLMYNYSPIDIQKVNQYISTEGTHM